MEDKVSDDNNGAAPGGLSERAAIAKALDQVCHLWKRVVLTRKQAENDAIAKLTVKLQSTVHKPIPECARDQRAVCAKKDEVCRARYALLSPLARGAVVDTCA